MELNQAFIAEIQNEAANTRKMLENVDMANWNTKPHEKSMTLGRLATHVAELPSWVIPTMQMDELDFTKMEYNPPTINSTEELVALHDANVNKAIEALNAAPAEDFGKMWTLRNGDHVIFTLPKAVVMRSMVLSHQYHHRGQLSVFLRMQDNHVPGMYGPSKDDELKMHEAMEAAASN